MRVMGGALMRGQHRPENLQEQGKEGWREGHPKPYEQRDLLVSEESGCTPPKLTSHCGIIQEHSLLLNLVVTG